MPCAHNFKKCVCCPVVLFAAAAPLRGPIWTIGSALTMGVVAQDGSAIHGAWDFENCTSDDIVEDMEVESVNITYDFRPFEQKYVPLPYRCPSNSGLGAVVLDVLDPQVANCSTACDDLPGCVGILNSSETTCSLLGPPPNAHFVRISDCDPPNVASPSVTRILHEWWRLSDFVESDMSQPAGVVRAAQRPSTAGSHVGDGQRYRAATAGSVQHRAAELAEATAAHTGATFGCGMQCLERPGCAAFGVLWVDGAPCSFRDTRQCSGCCKSSRGCDLPPATPIRGSLALQVEAMPQATAERQQEADGAQAVAAANAANAFCEAGGGSSADAPSAVAAAAHDACCDEVLRLDIITPACRQCRSTGVDNFGVPNVIPCCGAGRCPGAVLPR